MKAILFCAGLAACGAVSAAPVTYDIDPEHTYPSFEADHMGLSMWRGKCNKTSGKVVMDKAAGTGTVEIEIDTASIDFGHAKLNEYMAGPEQLDAKKFPTLRYKGKLERFVGGAPTAVSGELSMQGETRPVRLKVSMINRIPHPLSKRECRGSNPLCTLM